MTTQTEAEWNAKCEDGLANIALNYRRACDRWSGCRNPDGSLNDSNTNEANAFENKANDCMAALRAHLATRPQVPPLEAVDIQRIAESRAVLLPLVRRKLPHAEALDELVNYALRKPHGSDAATGSTK